jgi:hypothetical protein
MRYEILAEVKIENVALCSAVSFTKVSGECFSTILCRKGGGSSFLQICWLSPRMYVFLTTLEISRELSENFPTQLCCQNCDIMD